MILYLSGRDTDDLLMVLEGVAGVVFKRSDERKKRKYFEKGARKDSMGEVSAKVFLGSGGGAKARAAVREIVIEGRAVEASCGCNKRRGECGDRVGRAES